MENADIKLTTNEILHMQLANLPNTILKHN